MLSFDVDEVRAQLLLTNSSEYYAEIFETYPSTAGCTYKACVAVLINLAYVGAIALPTIPTGFILLQSVFYRRISLMSFSMDSATTKMQLVLFKALTLQILFIFAFLLIPPTLIFVLYIVGIHESLYVQICFFLLTLHFPFDVYVNVALIKHYREFIVNALRRLFGFCKGRTYVIELTT